MSGVVNRGSVPAPTLPKETVTVEALGGEVVVCGMLLTQRLAIQARMRQLRASAVEGGADPTMTVVPEVLALSVIDDEGHPVYTTQQWEVFGGQQQGQALGLFNAAMRLSGFDGKASEKN